MAINPQHEYTVSVGGKTASFHVVDGEVGTEYRMEPEAAARFSQPTVLNWMRARAKERADVRFYTFEGSVFALSGDEFSSTKEATTWMMATGAIAGRAWVDALCNGRAYADGRGQPLRPAELKPVYMMSDEARDIFAKPAVLEWMRARAKERPNAHFYAAPDGSVVGLAATEFAASNGYPWRQSAFYSLKRHWDEAMSGGRAYANPRGEPMAPVELKPVYRMNPEAVAAFASSQVLEWMRARSQEKTRVRFYLQAEGADHGRARIACAITKDEGATLNHGWLNVTPEYLEEFWTAALERGDAFADERGEPAYLVVETDSETFAQTPEVEGLLAPTVAATDKAFEDYIRCLQLPLHMLFPRSDPSKLSRDELERLQKDAMVSSGRMLDMIGTVVCVVGRAKGEPDELVRRRILQALPPLQCGFCCDRFPIDAHAEGAVADPEFIWVHEQCKTTLQHRRGAEADEAERLHPPLVDPYVDHWLRDLPTVCIGGGDKKQKARWERWQEEVFAYCKRDRFTGDDVPNPTSSGHPWSCEDVEYES